MLPALFVAVLPYMEFHVAVEDYCGPGMDVIVVHPHDTCSFQDDESFKLR